MKNTIRKTIAWILTLIMFIGTMPTNALASIIMVREGNIFVDSSISVRPGTDLLQSSLTNGGAIIQGREGMFSPTAQAQFSSATASTDKLDKYFGITKTDEKADEAKRASVIKPTYVVLSAFDIGVVDGDDEWQPAEGESVSVSIPLNVTVPEGYSLSLLHETGNSFTRVNSARFIKTGNSITSVEFTATGFSIYVVVGEGTDATPILTVKFMNGTEELATDYVKADDTDDELKTIVYDPGAGSIPTGQVFRGWSAVQGYDTETELLTIEDVRSAVKAKASSITEDTTVTYYAAIFKQYNVTYVDGKGIAVGSESTSIPNRLTDATYKVNQGYSTDDTHNFEGWLVRDGLNNIVNPNNATSTTLFTNGTEITIKGDVRFSVSAPEGHWLIFDENGKGGTYNAPRFIKAGQTTSDDGLLEMVRNGYTFEGWYTNKECTDGNEFTFGGIIEDTTTIYAKWKSITNANYTVLIWKQNLAGDGYDFVESITVENATVDSTPTAVNTQNGHVTGASYEGETGFSFKETDQASKTVAPEGNTVVNVYWNRNQYTLKFQIEDYTYTPTTSNGGTQYGLVNGSYVELYRDNNKWYLNREWSGGWNGHWNYSNEYTGTRYTRSNSTSWQTIKEITALYQQSISDYFPIVGTNGVTYNNGERWMPQSSSTYKEVLIYIDTMPAESVTFHLNTANHSTKYIYYYVEALPEDTDTVTYKGKSFVLYKDMSANYGYFTEAEDYININGFTKFGVYPETNTWGSGGASTVKCYYTRNKYSINYMDGAYYDGNNNRIVSETSSGQLKVENNILFDADLTSKNVGETGCYNPSAPEGYVFEGWYLDDACTAPYTFTKMPEGGITVYAKWRQIQFRVFLHPNAGTDATLDWGSTTQEMNFRVSYGGKISVPTGKRTGYEFYGWYTDAATSQAFTENAQIRDGSAYDKTTTFTDPMDKWGNGATTNGDVDRFWITKKFDLFAKWSEIIVGADGIGIIYDAGEGSNAPTDTSLYKDNTSVIAGAASKAPTAQTQNGKTQVFDCWVLQNWSGTEYVPTEITVYPGGTFIALKANAKITDAETDNVVAASDVNANGNYKYTIKLVARYKEADEETPTHIDWYSNYGSDNDGKGTLYTSYTNIKINEPQPILGAQTRNGYEFIGWTKTQGGTRPWIEWDGSKFTYNGTTVTKVAADERAYDDMFAVWRENEVTIRYEVASDSTDMGTVSIESETILAATGTAEGSTATATSDRYVFDYWTCDDGTEHVDDAAEFVPSKNNSGIYEAHTYYAHFKLNKASVTIHHYLKGTTTKVAEDDVSQETVGTEINPATVSAATEFLDDYEGFTLTKDSTNPTTTVTVTVDGAEITLYYTLPLTITAKTDSKTYDGTPLSGAYTVEGTLNDEDLTTIQGVLGDAPSITNAESLNYLTEAEQAEISGIPEYYAVTYTPGSLEIAKREVTVKVENAADVEYDGAEHTGETEYTFTNVVAGETATITYTPAKGTLVDTYTGSYGEDFKVMKGSEDVTANYTLTTKTPGKLEITDRTNKYEITVVANSNTGNVYDGTEKSATGFETLEFTVEGNTYTVSGLTTSDPSSTNVCNLANAISGTAVVSDANGNDVTSQFTVNTTDGTLEITQVKLTITADSNSKVYDGTALKDDGWNDTPPAGLKGKDAVDSVTVTGSQTLVGESANVASAAVVKNGDTDVTGNYDIEYVKGTLTVTDDNVDPDHVVRKTVDGGETTEFKLGQVVTFNIEATNIYDRAVTILLSEIDGVTLAQSTFENVGPGETIKTTATYTITEKAILDGGFTNTVTATVKELEKKATTTAKTEAPNGHITIEKVTTSEPANGETYALGEKITYNITVTNDGNLTITDVKVEDTLTGDVWTVTDPMKPGESLEFTAEYTVTENDILAGEVVNVATGTGKSPDPDKPDVPVVPGEDPEPTEPMKGHLTIKKVTTSETPEEGYALGAEITYEITAINDGNLTITDIIVKDDLTGDEWEIECLAPGASKTFEAKYTVIEADILAGEVVNTATATGKTEDPDHPDVPVDPGKDPEPTEKKNSHLTVNKETTSTPRDEKGYAEGEVISYKITVVNDGNLTITGITVTDDLTGDKWTIESLAPDVAKEFTTSYTVTAADAAAGKVLNVATAKGTSPDPKNPEVPVTPGEDPEPTYETKFTLIIRYWIGSKDGELINTVNRVEKAGTAYDVATPPMEGYTADTERVKGVLDKDMEYDVVYTVEDYTLTILYVYQDGTEASETYTDVLHFGEEYSVESPVINGYYTNKKKVEGTMPARDVTVTVIYVKNQVVITIDDFETPLGLGLGGINVGETIE